MHIHMKKWLQRLSPIVRGSLIVGIVLAASFVLLSERRARQFDLPAPSITQRSPESLVHALTYPTAQTFATPADDPEPPGDVFVPTLTGASSPKAPVIGLHTGSAAPDRSVVFSGDQISLGAEAPKVTVYAQTREDNGSLYQAAVVRSGPDTVTAITPESAPIGAYLAWVTNSSGTSQPVRINMAEAWWVGPNRGTPGQVISVYGRRLSRLSGTAESFVYIRPWAGGPDVRSTLLRNRSVNPHKVTVLLPDNLSGRDYEVWVHNGHGGKYGWSGPLRLRVDQTYDLAWRGRRIDITQFGATPSPGNDDTNAFAEALKTARKGDTIYLPAGEYRLSQPLEVGFGVSIEGEDLDRSVLHFLDGSGRGGSALRLHGFPARVRNLTIRSSIATGLRSENSILRFDGRDQNPTPWGVRIERVKCYLPGNQFYSCFATDHVNGIFVNNNDFFMPSGIILRRTHQAFIHDNTFFGNWPDIEYSPLAAIGSSVSAQVDISNNRASSGSRAGRETLSRFFVAQGHSHGATHDHYIADNHLRSIGCAEETCGENILIEAPGTLLTAKAATITANSVSFSGVNWMPGSISISDPDVYQRAEDHRPCVLLIQSGKGQGQYRLVTTNTHDTLTIDRPWDVAPDSTSVFTLATGAYRFAVYRNSIEGWTGAKLNKHRINVGIQNYGTIFDSEFRENRVAGLSRGIEVSSLINKSCGFTIQGHSVAGSDNNCPVWGTIIEGNTIFDTLHGIVSWSRTENPRRDITGPALLNNVIRDNVIRQSAGPAISIGDINIYPNKDEWQTGAIVESNLLIDSKINIELLGLQSRTLIRKNRMISENGGSVGVFIGERVLSFLLCDNSYSGAFQDHVGAADPTGISLLIRSAACAVNN